DAADPAFDGGRAQEEIRLLARVPPRLQVLDRVEAGTPVRDGGVHVMLPVALHAHPDEGKERRVPRLDRPGEEDGVGGDAVLAHAALDEVDAEVDVAADLDRPAEGDLAVALGEMQVAAGELRARDMHGVVDAR